MTQHDPQRAGGHDFGSMKPMYVVWSWLITLSLVEVFLAYKQVPIHIMLVALLGMSTVKAALIVSWFMHLKFEKRSLALTLIPAVTTCILLFNIVFPDSFRLGHLAVNREPKPGAESTTHESH